MLNKEELVELFDHLGLPPKGRSQVLRARLEAPVRAVKSQGGNVITLFASRKMGREIRTESRHIEFAAAVDKEYNPAVIEYYAQPCLLRLELIDDVTGEIRAIQHTPDYLVIAGNGITLEEWKTEAKLARLAERHPYRYQKGSDGRWYAPQIERQLAELGIRYRVLSDASLPRKRVENLLHLADYLHPAAPPCPGPVLERLQAVLREHGAVYISALLSAPFSFNADELNKAVADNLVVADLDREALHQPLRARLYRDATLRDFLAAEVKIGRVPGQTSFVVDIAPGAVFRYESQELTISLVGEHDIVCTLGNGSTRTLSRDWLLDAIDKNQVTPIKGLEGKVLDLARYKEEELRVAARRDVMLASAKPPVSDRTLRRWLARQKSTLANGGNKVLALVPQTAGRGNRTPRLSEEQEHWLSHIIETKWSSPEARNYKTCYRELVVACESAGIKPPAYPTLIERIKAVEDARTTRGRHGKRMAYQLSEFVDVLYVDTPAHGSRPFQYVHIDHTQLDIELISSRTGKPLGRPWLSFAVDAYSRRIVALYLTFDPPSYHSVMMVVRDLVRRFGRLPEFVVVDNGRDFMSSAFETFLEVMGTHLRFRPAGQPRHGAVLERMFGRANTEYIHNLSGNTKATKNVRMTTGKHMPVNFAEWTLESMYHGITYWATEYYDHNRHPALDCSPREAFQRGVTLTGARPQRQILFNEDFLIATCPPVDRGGVRVAHHQRGVKVNDMLYWHADFRDPRYAGQKWPVRYDPWDASSVYVRLKDRWVRARCRNLMGLGQLTEHERRALTEEYINSSGAPVNDERGGQRLREFMQVFTPQGAMAAAFERQAENKALFNQLQLSCIQPVEAAPKTWLIENTNIEPSTTYMDDSRTISPLGIQQPPQAAATDDLPDFDTF